MCLAAAACCVGRRKDAPSTSLVFSSQPQCPKKSMRRYPLLVFALVCIASATWVGDAGARHTRPLCVIHRCKTIEANARVRVYRATSVLEGVTVYSGTFARWVMSRRITPLGDQYHEEEPGLTLERLALSGRYAAYALVRFGKYNGEGTYWKVLRLNVKAGRGEEVRSDFGGPRGEAPPECSGGLPFTSPGITDLVVTPKGAVAWIIGRKDYDPYASNPRPNPSSYRLCELTAGSRTPMLLANSGTIAPKSLATVSGHLYWTEGGTSRSAFVL
jgi:hypothetical protein